MILDSAAADALALPRLPRYQSIRRTMTPRMTAAAAAASAMPLSMATSNPPLAPAVPCSGAAPSPVPVVEEVVVGGSASVAPSAPPAPVVPSADSQRALLRSPAVRFTTRSDFFNVLHMNDDALAAYNRSSSLKHMIAKIRRDPANFERYQHNRDLVSLLNKFADKTRELPRGWETKLDRSGKQFFIDHTSRSTTFIDPRLPIDVPYLNPSKLVVPLARRRSRSAGEDDGQRADAAARREGCHPRPAVLHIVSVVGQECGREVGRWRCLGPAQLPAVRRPRECWSQLEDVSALATDRRADGNVAVAGPVLR
ncbi:hypothetical protein HPB51_018249 [Rhipicephalus microplus]|uniref:WW domain-containing protein n=1 Tax=Rhipicephalus microplus TaxID=6941 RepID=A0A9J6D650_RHIMP|nr:hypothetical protein HPB51_018249 [Rhipicephalus microplus]